MRWHRLPPAGNPIVWHEKTTPTLALPGYHLVWVSSGTAALAYSLMNHRSQHPTVTHPEVIVPGYCCPDLLAAAHFAGYTPVVVDIGQNDPGYDLDELQQALSAHTLAVIAINFLGIEDRLTALRARLQSYPQVALIEDNAQWFPAEPDQAIFTGDYLTFSFGRGKAIGLLDGGLVAVRDAVSIDLALPESGAGRGWPLKAWLVNQLARPRAFYWLNQLPFIELGTTAYHELSSIEGVPLRTRLAFEANYRCYIQRSARPEVFYDRLMARLGWNQLTVMSSQRRDRLLRYPVLCVNKAQRDRLLHRLTAAGLGASALYQAELARIAGVQHLPHVRYCGDLANATQFAARLLTLPTHEGMDAETLEQVAGILEDSA